jgi:hypothetical protein
MSTHCELLLREGNEAECAHRRKPIIMGSVVNDLKRPPNVRDRLAEYIDPEAAPFMQKTLPVYSPAVKGALSWMTPGGVRL